VKIPNTKRSGSGSATLRKKLKLSAKVEKYYMCKKVCGWNKNLLMIGGGSDILG
jgi:hypothetical protein